MSRLQDVILRDVFVSRPTPSIAGRLFYATDTLHWYRDNGSTWDLQDSGVSGGGGLLAANNLSDVASAATSLANVSGAPNSARFVTTQSESLLTNEVNLGSLSSGILKQNVTGGVAAISTAVAGTDYYQPGTSGGLDTISGLAATHPNFIQSVSGVWNSRTPAQAAASLPAMVGDSGSGGTKGLVPAPNAGDAAAQKFLKADGTFATPSGTGAPVDAKYITAQAESGLSAEVNMGALTTGIPKMTISTGVAALSRAVEAVDYYAPGYSGQLDTISGLSPGNAQMLGSTSGAWAARTAAQIAAILRGNAVNTLAAGDDTRFNSVSANTQTVSYTLVAADAGKVVELNCVSACTLTVPPQSSVAWPDQSAIEIFQYGAGQITITPGSGVTIRSDGAKTKTTAQYATVGLRLRPGNANEWVASGDLST